MTKTITIHNSNQIFNLEIRTARGLYFVKVNGGEETVLSFSIMLPNMAQANSLKERILKNPKYYCDAFIELLTDDIAVKSEE